MYLQITLSTNSLNVTYIDSSLSSVVSVRKMFKEVKNYLEVGWGRSRDFQF